MHARQELQEDFNPAPSIGPSTSHKGRLAGVATLEERLCNTLAEYSEDFPEDAFPSYLESQYFEELC